MIFIRGPEKQRQDVWYSRVTEKLEGLDTIETYTIPRRMRVTVSATSGTPEEIASGIVPSYDRYITSYKRKLDIRESDVLWVDKIPKTDNRGQLLLNPDLTPMTPPDFVLKKIIGTARGIVTRYGITRIGGE